MPPPNSKILFILNRIVIGGQSLDSLPLLSYMQEKYEISLLHGQKELDEEDAEFLLEKYPVTNVFKINSLQRSFNPFHDIKAFMDIYKYLRLIRPNIVHTHGAKPGMLGRIAAKLAGVKIIVHTFHGHAFHSYFGWFKTKMLILAEKTLARLCSRIIVLSTDQQHEIVDVYKIAPASKTTIIPLGIDYVENADILAGQIFRNNYQITSDTVIIGAIGRMVPIKNFAFLIVVMDILLKKHSNIKLVITGNGYLRNDLENQLQKLNISFCNTDAVNGSAKVIFTSWVKDINEVIHAFDIVALTSLNEGTPLSIIEAQMAGKPVVASNVGGVKDCLVNNKSGVLVNGGDAELFAAELSKLIDDQPLRQQMGTVAAAWSREKFSKQAEVDKMDNLYQQLLHAL